MNRRTPGPRSLASRLRESKSATARSKPEPEIQTLTIQPFGRHVHVEKLLDVSPNTVDKLIKEAGLPVIKIGGLVRFDLEAVRAWAVRRQIQEAKDRSEKAG